MPHPLAGTRVPADMLMDVPALLAAYADAPDVNVATQRVAFGTCGHRGSSLHRSFNEAHILAITQAICEYRARQGIDGPLFIGKDTHALSEPALAAAARGARGQRRGDGHVNRTTATPRRRSSRTPSSRTTAARTAALADGIVITPSHNPPEDGGFKYNPPHGGPADTDVTRWIEDRANALLADGNAGVTRMPYAQAIAADGVSQHDFVDRLRRRPRRGHRHGGDPRAGLRIGVDPMGGAAVAYWAPHRRALRSRHRRRQPDASTRPSAS